MPDTILAKQLRCLERYAKCSFDKTPKILGEGGFGIVIQGTYVGGKSSQPVAVKIAKQSANHQESIHEAFQNEIRMLHKLAPPHRPHAHIVTLILGGGLVQDSTGLRTSSLILELCRTGTLHEHVSHDTLPMARVEILHQVCVGLAFIHGKGIYHRDIKTENILIQYAPGQGYTCKIADFGLATDQLYSLEVAGTTIYLPPEAHCFEGPINAAMCDVFAVGVVLYVMLQRKYPWEGGSDKKRFVEAQLWKAKIADEFKSFFAAVWAYDPERRESAGKLERRASKLMHAKKK